MSLAGHLVTEFSPGLPVSPCTSLVFGIESICAPRHSVSPIGGFPDTQFMNLLNIQTQIIFLIF